MQIIPGSFDKNSGSPTVTITVSGLFKNPCTIEAIIDTGFSGFLSMPLMKAFPIGLTLYGTTTVTLADGSTANKLTALGMINISNIEKSGVIILEEATTDPLLGMGFLRTFGFTLAVTKDKVALMDEELITRIQSENPQTKPPD